MLVERTALSFATGLLFQPLRPGGHRPAVDYGLLPPPAVLLGLLFGAINLAGLAWPATRSACASASASGAVGDALPAILGILVPGAFIAVLWVLGSCFGFFAFIGALALTSFGTGALLVKFLKLGEARGPETGPTRAHAARAAVRSSQDSRSGTASRAG